MTEQGEQYVIITSFNPFLGNYQDTVYIIGKNKTLGALVKFNNGTQQWISKEHLETLCTGKINWRKIYNITR